jgi:5-methylcytosine-specific restriction endonuclease McrA
VVYIQVAHLDHDVTNCDRANLRALCQRCHLIYDARLHAMNSYATRRLGRAIGDLFAT